MEIDVLIKLYGEIGLAAFCHTNALDHTRAQFGDTHFGELRKRHLVTFVLACPYLYRSFACIDDLRTY